MKKYGLRIALFILSFILGISLVWLINQTIVKFQILETNYKTRTNEVLSEKEGINEIDIKFKEFVEEYNVVATDFVITNNSNSTFIYSGLEKDKTIIHTQPDLRINGEFLDLWMCGFGYTDQKLKPGETKIFRTRILSLGFTKGKSIQIGFKFTKEEKLFIFKVENQTQTFWSEDLPITEAIEEKLLKEQQSSH